MRSILLAPRRAVVSLLCIALPLVACTGRRALSPTAPATLVASPAIASAPEPTATPVPSATASLRAATPTLDPTAVAAQVQAQLEAIPTSVDGGPVEGWTGTLVKNCSMAQFDDYFQRDDGQRWGVEGATEAVEAEIERLRCQPATQVRVWGRLETETMDVGGRRIAVERLQVLAGPPSPTPWPGPNEEPVDGWEGYIVPCGGGNAERSFVRAGGARLAIDSEQAEALEALRRAECEGFPVRIWGTLYREAVGLRVVADRVEKIEAGADSGRAIFFARDDDVWRTDVGGTLEEPLSEGRALNWRQWVTGWGTHWLLVADVHPPSVSPDGRWIAFSTGDDVRIIGVAQPGQRVVAQPGAYAVDWAPDSQSLAYVVSSAAGDTLCVYDVERGEATSLLSRQGIKHFAWSPDSRSIAFTCCFREVEPYTVTGRSIGQVQRLDVGTQRVETVAEAEIRVASSCSLCWTGDGRVITTTVGAVRCSPQDARRVSDLSPDGTRIAQVAPLYAVDGTASGARLTVALYADGRTGSTLWEREVHEAGLSRVRWSPDGQYLLLDDSEAHSPIWRLPADGAGDLEVVADNGYLLDVIPEWGR